MIENEFNHLKPAHMPLGPKTNTTSSPPARGRAAERNQKHENPAPFSTCLASPASPLINAPPGSPSTAKNFAAATTSTGFETKLIQPFSKEFKRNQTKKNIADPMTTTPLPKHRPGHQIAPNRAESQ
jgi:hypothetical protein